MISSPCILQIAFVALILYSLVRAHDPEADPERYAGLMLATISAPIAFAMVCSLFQHFNLFLLGLFLFMGLIAARCLHQYVFGFDPVEKWFDWTEPPQSTEEMKAHQSFNQTTAMADHSPADAAETPLRADAFKQTKAHESRSQTDDRASLKL